MLGEEVNFTVNISNESSADISDCTVGLTKTVSYKAVNKTKHKIFHFETNQCPFAIRQNDSKHWRGTLKSPTCITIGPINNCNIILIKYELILKVEFSAVLSISEKVIIPITFGTEVYEDKSQRDIDVTSVASLSIL